MIDAAMQDHARRSAARAFLSRIVIATTNAIAHMKATCQKNQLSGLACLKQSATCSAVPPKIRGRKYQRTPSGSKSAAATARPPATRRRQRDGGAGTFRGRRACCDRSGQLRQCCPRRDHNPARGSALPATAPVCARTGLCAKSRRLRVMMASAPACSVASARTASSKSEVLLLSAPSSTARVTGATSNRLSSCRIFEHEPGTERPARHPFFNGYGLAILHSLPCAISLPLYTASVRKP